MGRPESIFHRPRAFADVNKEAYRRSVSPASQANARGTTASRIGQQLSCSDQAVRDAIRAFNKAGLASLRPGSSVLHHIERAFEKEQAERLRTLLHQSPRNFGKPTSLWTLALAAEVSYAERLTSKPVSAETVRATQAPPACPAPAPDPIPGVVVGQKWPPFSPLEPCRGRPRIMISRKTGDQPCRASRSSCSFVCWPVAR